MMSSRRLLWILGLLAPAACSSAGGSSTTGNQANTLSALEVRVMGRWSGSLADHYTRIWVLYPDRRGCEFKLRLPDTFNHIDQLDFHNWRIDESHPRGEFVVPVLYAADSNGNTFNLDTYDLQNDRILVGNIKALGMTRTDNSWRCHPSDTQTFRAPGSDAGVEPPADAGGGPGGGAPAPPKS